MKGRSKSSGLDRAGNPPAERFPQVTPTEGRPRAASLKTPPIIDRDSKQQVGLADLMHVTHTNECPFIHNMSTNKRELEWYHGKDFRRSPSRLQVYPRKLSLDIFNRLTSTEDWDGRAFLLGVFVIQIVRIYGGLPQLIRNKFQTHLRKIEEIYGCSN